MKTISMTDVENGTIGIGSTIAIQTGTRYNSDGHNTRVFRTIKIDRITNSGRINAEGFVFATPSFSNIYCGYGKTSETPYRLEESDSIEAINADREAYVAEMAAAAEERKAAKQAESKARQEAIAATENVAMNANAAAIVVTIPNTEMAYIKMSNERGESAIVTFTTWVTQEWDWSNREEDDRKVATTHIDGWVFTTRSAERKESNSFSTINFVSEGKSAMEIIETVRETLIKKIWRW